MIYDPQNMNMAFDDDGTLMMRIITHDIGEGADLRPAEQFVPMPQRFEFRRPEW